jgi:cytochrome P450
MEAATTTVPRTAAKAAKDGFPPGPPLPMPLQTAIWSRQARRLLYSCQDRYGDIFTLKILGETWAVLADPEAVKQVFTGDPRVFHAGEGNGQPAPLLGAYSLLVLDEGVHMSQRKLLLPPFHGRRMQAYEATMSEIAEREIASWPSGEPYALRPGMQALTLEIILRTVFGAREGEGLAELRDALRRYLDLLSDPRQLLPVVKSRNEFSAGQLLRRPATTPKSSSTEVIEPRLGVHAAERQCSARRVAAGAARRRLYDLSRSRCCCRTSCTCNSYPCAASCRRTARRRGRGRGRTSSPGRPAGFR